MTVRILFLGENWYGSCARACCFALRRLGCNVADVDITTFMPQVHRFSSRALRRLFRDGLVREYNEAILSMASQFQPDLLLAFKAAWIKPDTLRALRQQGILSCNYFPDTSAFTHGPVLPTALPEYDCVFYTKPFWIKDVSVQLQLRDSAFLAHGYDPDLHQEYPLDNRDLAQYGYDVTLIATHSGYKEELLRRLVEFKPNLHLRIWGNCWQERCRSQALRPLIAGPGLFGTSYAKALRATRINLAIPSGIVAGASQGDDVTTRTFEIPACGGFMLHERNDELLACFEEAKEVACFGSPQELAEKIDYYLACPEERECIRRAGYARCVPAYSYDHRMAEILRWYSAQVSQSPHKANHSADCVAAGVRA